MLFSFGRFKMTALRLCAMLLFITISNAQGQHSTPSLKNIEPDNVDDSSKGVLPWRLKNIKPIPKYIELPGKRNVGASPLSRQGNLFMGMPNYGMNPPFGLPFGSPMGSNSQGLPNNQQTSQYPQVSPFGNNPQVSPFGNNPQVSPYGNNPQISPYGNNPQTSLFGNNPQTSPYGNNQQTSPYGSLNNAQVSPYGSNPQVSPFGSNPQGLLQGSKPHGSFGAQYAGGYSTGNMFGQYSSTSNPYQPYGSNAQVSSCGTNSQGSPSAIKQKGSFGAQYAGGYSTGNSYGQYSKALNPYGRQRMRTTRNLPDVEQEVHNHDLIKQVVPLPHSYDVNNNQDKLRGVNQYSHGRYKPIITKITGAYPHYISAKDWSHSHPPKQHLKAQPVAAVANFEEYICAIYNKNLLTTWRMLSTLISGHEMDSPGQDVLTNLFKLIRIYLLLHSGEGSDEEKEHNLRESGNILMDASNPEHNRPPINSQRQPIAQGPKYPGFTTEITDAPLDDNSVGLDVVFPVPKNKCQETALNSLVDTFKKLYIQYLTHVDKCDGSRQPPPPRL